MKRLRSFGRAYASTWWVRAIVSAVLFVLLVLTPASMTPVQAVLAGALGLSLVLLLLLPAALQYSPEPVRSIKE